MVAVFVIASLLSAALVFLVQPMAAKALLPQLGGSPMVWNTCMVFFQSALLAAYAYAHASARWLGHRQVWLHAGVLLLGLLSYPLSLDPLSALSPVQQPALYVLSLLALSVGPLYLIIAATAPLLQYWLAQTDHPAAHEPYFLYSSSNIGSVAGLALYPLLIERLLPLNLQLRLFEGLYGALIVLLLLCMGLARRRRRPGAPANNGQEARQEQSLPPASASVPWREIASWLWLSFIPAGLLYGVSLHIATDIASMPLLWVVPLTLYLLSFILAFAKGSPGVRSALALAPYAIILALLAYILRAKTIGLLLPLLAFFVLALAIHGLLYAKRPHPRHLTGYYLWISLGGVLGGLFATLLAPLLFQFYMEYFLMLALASLVLIHRYVGFRWPALLQQLRKPALLVMVALGVGLVVLGRVAAFEQAALLWQFGAVFVAVLLLSVLAGSAQQRSVQAIVLLLGLGFNAALAMYLQTDLLKKDFVARNFFGISQISTSEEAGDRIRTYSHGNTKHGIQSTLPERETRVMAYYEPLNAVMERFPRLHREPLAVLGLGAGTLNCLAARGQQVDLFEIDPIVSYVAERSGYFTYLDKCPTDYRIILGDGRLKLREQPDGRYGLMVMDAFTSDAIPVHLLTKEALALYLCKAQPDGLIAFNISNRHLNLVPLLSGLSDALGVHGAWRGYQAPEDSPYIFPSKWFVISADKGVIGQLLDSHPDWKPHDAASRQVVWTDRYSNLLSLVTW